MSAPEPDAVSPVPPQPGRDAVEVEFELDAAYFAESYREWRASLSRFRKYQFLIGLSLAAAGVGVVAMTDWTLAGGMTSAIGAIECVEYLWHPRRWVAGRLATRPADGLDAMARWHAAQKARAQA